MSLPADGAWRIEEPLLEELSADPISCLHVLGAEVWAASAGNIFKLVVKQPSDDAVTVRKVRARVVRCGVSRDHVITHQQSASF